MAKTTPPKTPKLYFANEQGAYSEEYIPGEHFTFADWLRCKHIYFRDYYHKDIYYWHVRHFIPPISRKVMDIAFILHVIQDHDYEPEDGIERRHFKRAWALYGHEISYVLAEIAKDENSEPDSNGFTFGHPYAYAYTKQWYEKFPEMETKLLYHGIGYNQYIELLDIFIERGQQREIDMYKEYGLDPVTGKKMTSAKKPSRSKSKTAKKDNSLPRSKLK